MEISIKFKYSLLLLCSLMIYKNSYALPLPAQEKIPITIDDKFVKVNEKLAGFGGLYFDDNGDLNIYLTNPNGQGLVKAALNHAFGDNEIENMSPRTHRNFKGKPTLPINKFRIIKAKYNFKQLHDWKKLSDNVFSIDSVISTDIDDRNNRITIGVTDLSQENLIRDYIDSLGIPQEALTIKQQQQRVNHNHNWSPTTLQGANNTLRGGLYIKGSSGSNCSMGPRVIATHNNEEYIGFLTNSHCTTTRGVTDGDTFTQGGRYVGTEQIDIPSFSCLGNNTCYNTDAVFVGTVNGEGVEGTVKGEHFHTIGLNDGSINLHKNHKLKQAGWGDNAVIGAIMDKVGRKSGWTYGKVYEICFDVRASNDNSIIRCSNAVKRLNNTYKMSLGGDSGAPVFKWSSPDWARLNGVLWGGLPDDSDFVYTPFNSIRSDFEKQGWTVRTHNDLSPF